MSPRKPRKEKESAGPSGMPPADEAAEGEAQQGQEEPVEDAGPGEKHLRTHVGNVDSQGISELGVPKRQKRK